MNQKTPASNAPFSGGKGSLREGGVRVAAFVNWPGKLKPRVVEAPLDMVDVMPTLLTLAGAKGDPDHPFDGKDMWGTIVDGAPSPHDAILINVEAFRGAIRKGDWKLIKIALLPGKTHWPYELVIVAFFGDPIDVGGWMAERLAAIGIGPKSFQPVSSVISMTMFGRCACASRSAAT